jgi:hypothetical protein
VLDIQGVAAKWSEQDGLGILEHLKARNPAQIVIAFSGRSFDLSKNRFWKLADDALAKPIDAATAKRVLDDMIEKKRTPTYYWSVAAASLRTQGVSDKDLAKLEHQVTKALATKNEPAIRKAVSSLVGDHADVALKVAAIIMKIVSLLHS